MPDDAFSPILQTSDWQLYSQGRARQRLTGLVAAVLLILAFAVLVDGLLSRMLGGGSFRLEMVAGTSEPISGPMGSKPASESEVRAFPIPMDAPISFDFEGFFSSYWFGTGMWRGTVHVSETAESGVYALAVGVEGQSSSSFQTYTISVARSPEEQDRQSLSLVRRTTGWNPFYLAAFLGAVGLGCALGSFSLGMRCSRLLRDMGLAEVFKVRPDGELLRVFTVTGKREVSGKSFLCFDSALRRLGKVIVDREKGGISECLFVKGERGVPQKGSLISFWEPALPEMKPMRRGLFGPALSRCMNRSADQSGKAADSMPGQDGDNGGKN
ncbi:MAG: hypothetical protein Q4F72_00520 [Desulfovibrionaceae bacterium]|nr:hypothetical protein [Desulfovibrionaceae bacterium]